MTRNVTFSVDEQLLEAAREAAKAEGSSLNEQFRLWLERYVRQRQADRALAVMERIASYAASGGEKFSRDELNARR